MLKTESATYPMLLFVTFYHLLQLNTASVPAYIFDLNLKLWCPNKKEYGRLAGLCSTFTHSVDNLLFLPNYLRIEKFKLHFDGTVFPPHMRVSSWICAIVMCNVCELDLAIGYKDSGLGELPWSLFTCKTLVVLKLSGQFILNVPHYACLPNLKTLHLDSIIYLDDASFRKLLSGCPHLEDLEIIIHDWDPMWIHNVDLSSLKRFSLCQDRDNDRTCRRDDDQYKIVVDAPNLEFIDLRTWSEDILLKNLPNIVEAHLDIDTVGYISDEVVTVLQSMVNVKRLFLSECTLASLSYSIELALPTFCNLVQLELCYIPRDGPVRLMDLLCSSPKLEALSMPSGIYYNGDDRDTEYDHNPEQVPECLHSSLKSIQIEDFFSEEVELGIVEYLLENAMVLEKMTIFCYPKPTSEEFVELKAKLTNYSRLSTECQLDLLYQFDPLYEGKKADFCFSTDPKTRNQQSGRLVPGSCLEVGHCRRSSTFVFFKHKLYNIKLYDALVSAAIRLKLSKFWLLFFL